MGTINYFTSDYITVGYNMDQDFGFETFEENEDYMYMDIEDSMENIEALIEKYDFYYYNVYIKYGYYSGFSIDIECNFRIAWDDCYQKRKAQKEITRLKNFLLECLDYGLCVIHPGWCTTYLNRDDSKKEIIKAIVEIRSEAKNTPTWAQYEREGKQCY